jgi:hypothetical protein
MSSKISSHSGFQPLEEVWLGGIYPSSFYSRYDNKTQDVFEKISELTNLDLKQIEKKLQELGVVVRRPDFTIVENYLDQDDNLIKPPICPRDWALTLGDTLYISPQYSSGIEPFQSTIDLYTEYNQKVKILNRSKNCTDSMAWVAFPSFVRVGKDIYIDYPHGNLTCVEHNEKAIAELSKHYRVHVTNTGDHSDGVFCPVHPKHIFSTHYKQNYEKTFPGWDVFFLTDTTISRKSNGWNGRWYIPNYNYIGFNPQIISLASDWIGDVGETVFEVNMLVIDEKNVICIAEDDVACRKLESIGITPHVMDFKTRGFWDGGIHCITLDIHRDGNCLDYWPDRGQAGTYRY